MTTAVRICTEYFKTSPANEQETVTKYFQNKYPNNYSAVTRLITTVAT